MKIVVAKWLAFALFFLIIGCGKEKDIGQKTEQAATQPSDTVEYEIEVSHYLMPKDDSIPLQMAGGKIVIPEGCEVKGSVNISVISQEQSSEMSFTITGVRKEKGFTFYQCGSSGEFFRDAAGNARPVIRKQKELKNLNLTEKLKSTLEKPSPEDIFVLWKYKFEQSLKDYLSEFELKTDDEKYEEINFLCSFYHPMVDDVIRKLTQSNNQKLALVAKEELRKRK